MASYRKGVSWLDQVKDPGYDAMIEQAQGILNQPQDELTSAMAARNPRSEEYQPRLSEEQRGQAKLRGILAYGGKGGKEGGALGLLAGMIEGPGIRRDQFTYQNYLDDLIKQGGMNTEQQQALYARRYGGESYSATARPWWSSRTTLSQKPTFHTEHDPSGRLSRDTAYYSSGEAEPGEWYPRQAQGPLSDTEQRIRMEDRTAVQNARAWWKSLDAEEKEDRLKEWREDPKWGMDKETRSRMDVARSTFMGEDRAVHQAYLDQFEKSGKKNAPPPPKPKRKSFFGGDDEEEYNRASRQLLE